jgi:hypothetical protein
MFTQWGPKSLGIWNDLDSGAMIFIFVVKFCQNSTSKIQKEIFYWNFPFFLKEEIRFFLIIII